MNNKCKNLMLIFLLLVGLYFPTSSHGIINVKYEQIMLFALMSILLFLLVVNGKFKVRFQFSYIYSFFIMFTLLLFTLVSLSKGYTELFLGVLVQYIILSLLLVMDFTNIKLTNLTKKIFILVNLVNIILGLGVVFNSTIVKTFLLDHYSNFYPELLINMLIGKKPVIMFSSHGLAGTFFFLFFFINFKTFTVNKQKFYLLLSLLNLMLLFCSRSTTSYVLFLAGIINIAYYIYKSKKSYAKPLIAMLALISVTIAFVIVSNSSLAPDFNSDIHGFKSRYSSVGILKPTIDYILNTITPIGVANIPGLFNADSGWIINILRGSVFLLFTVYAGFYLFLKHNTNKRIALWIFLIFIAVEFGFQIMTYIRMMYFLPVLVAYLHDLAVVEPQGHVSKKYL